MCNPRNTSNGFTLLEMLVATTILVILLVIGLGAVNNITTLTSQTTQRLDVNRVARESLDQIGREISEAAVPWNRHDSGGSLQFMLNPPNGVPGNNGSFSTVSDSIFWQLPIANNTFNSDFGNLAVVGYFVISDTTRANPADWRLQLRRMYVEPETSGSVSPEGAIVSGSSNPNYQLYSGTGCNYTGSGTATDSAWTSGSSGTLSAVFAPSGGTNPAYTDLTNGMQGWVADGVLAMWVRCLDKSGNPITVTSGTAPLDTGTSSSGATVYTYNSSTAYSSSDLSGYDPYNYPSQPPSTSGNALYYTAMPAYVDVAIACISPSEMARLHSLPAVPATDPVNFLAAPAIGNYFQQFHTDNPGVKSLQYFSRRFRIYNSD